MNKTERLLLETCHDNDKLRAMNERLLKRIHTLTHAKVSRKSTKEQLRKALTCAVHSHGHDLHCSAARGLESDCHCGWLEVVQLANGK